MAKYNGSGWHKQSIRHSRARKYGKAGGIYASKRVLHYGISEYQYMKNRIADINVNEQDYKEMVLEELQSADITRKQFNELLKEAEETPVAEPMKNYGKSEEPETMFFNSHKIKIMKAETNEPTKFKFTIDDYYTGFGNTRKEAINNAKAGIKDIDDAHPPTLEELKETFPSDFKIGKKIYTKIDGQLYSYTEGKQATTMKKEKNLNKIIKGQVTQANFNLFV